MSQHTETTKTVTIDKQVLLALVKSLQECSQDLEYEINARYEGTLDYQVQKRRYERDTQPINEARDALNAYLGEMVVQ